MKHGEHIDRIFHALVADNPDDPVLAEVCAMINKSDRHFSSTCAAILHLARVYPPFAEIFGKRLLASLDAALTTLTDMEREPVWQKRP